MAITLLILSFFSALYGAWVFISGYMAAENATQQLTAAMTGLAFAIIPYLIAKSLAEIVAMRQRYVMVDQTHFQQGMMLEAMQQVASESTAEPAATAKTTTSKTETPAPPPSAS